MSAALPLLASLALGGCISSTAPILGDAGAILGERGQIHVFSAAIEGVRSEHQVVSFRWTGKSYALRGRSVGATEFTAHAFEGRDLILQSRASKAPHPIEYSLARKLADGTFLVTVIDEADADDAARSRFCTKTPDASCRITTPEQLFVFARATAAKEDLKGGIAVVMPSRPR
jgi:hypothetical protein